MTEKLGYSVLVVDDEPDIRDIVASGFKRLGCTVYTASSGNEAIKVLDEKKVDAVVTDMRMPGGNGVELLTTIKSRDYHTPVVVFVTGFSDALNEDIYDMGAEAIFSKPFRREELVKTVLRCLKSREEAWSAPVPSAEVKGSLERTFKDVESARSSGELSFGRGGFFLAENAPTASLNDCIEVTLRFESGEIKAIQGTGKVRWMRSTKASEPANGYGLEILQVTDDGRGKLIELLRKLEIRAFIPKK